MSFVYVRVPTIPERGANNGRCMCFDRWTTRPRCCYHCCTPTRQGRSWLWCTVLINGVVNTIPLTLHSVFIHSHTQVRVCARYLNCIRVYAISMSQYIPIWQVIDVNRPWPFSRVSRFGSGSAQTIFTLRYYVYQKRVIIRHFVDIII